MVIFIFAFLPRAQRYLPCATCSAAAWYGWNGSPGEEGNGALLLPAASSAPLFTLGRASPASSVIALLAKPTGTPLLQSIQLNVLRFNATLLIGRKGQHWFQMTEKPFPFFLTLHQSTFPPKIFRDFETNTLIYLKYPGDGFLCLNDNLTFDTVSLNFQIQIDKSSPNLWNH